MLISNQHRFLFIANTKTASTAIETALHPFADHALADGSTAKHLSLRQLLISEQAKKNLLQSEPCHYLKFGVMRDPLEWIFSWYRYRLGNYVDAPLSPDVTFVQFWRRKDWNFLRPDGSGKYLQKDIFCCPDGEVLADVIIRYDQLKSEFSNLCKVMGLQASLEFKNVSRIKNNPSISEGLRAELVEFYKDDYALYAGLDQINTQSLAKWKLGSYSA